MSPFPGMDPYLEAPDIWPDFHERLASVISEMLNAKLPEPYYSRLQMRPEMGVVLEDGMDYTLYPVPLREPLPFFPIPLADNNPDIPLDLQIAVQTVCQRALYRRMVDYASDPQPPLSGEDTEWANSLLKGAGLRETA